MATHLALLLLNVVANTLLLRRASSINVTFGIKHTSGFASRQRELCRLIWSIRESYKLDPILVAYDGSTSYESEDEPCAEASHVSYINLGLHGGLSAGRNAIVRNTLTEFVMIMDDDVTFIKGSTRVESLVNHLRAHPSLTLVAACHDREPASSWANVFSNRCYAHNLTWTGSTVKSDPSPARGTERVQSSGAASSASDTQHLRRACPRPARVPMGRASEHDGAHGRRIRLCFGGGRH